LWDGEHDVSIESADDEGSLSIAGAARHTDAKRVDVGCCYGLRGVDEAGDAPGLSGCGTGVHGAAVEVEKEDCAVRGAVLLCCHASLSKVMVTTPNGIGILTPPIPMIAGYGPAPLVGAWIVAKR
jgi:hypothetical protein